MTVFNPCFSLPSTLRFHVYKKNTDWRKKTTVTLYPARNRFYIRDPPSSPNSPNLVSEDKHASLSWLFRIAFVHRARCGPVRHLAGRALAIPGFTLASIEAMKIKLRYAKCSQDAKTHLNPQPRLTPS